MRNKRAKCTQPWETLGYTPVLWALCVLVFSVYPFAFCPNYRPLAVYEDTFVVVYYFYFLHKFKDQKQLEWVDLWCFPISSSCSIQYLEMQLPVILIDFDDMRQYESFIIPFCSTLLAVVARHTIAKIV